jgi:hypothetical protein
VLSWTEFNSVAPVLPPVHPRKLAKVPFVELADGQLQGVVSSGSDIERVYVCSISANTHNFNCGTNNNRPCGGLYRDGCKHLQLMADEAITQFGAERVMRFLRLDLSEIVTSGGVLFGRLHGTQEKTPGAPIFARFLRHLSYLEVPVTSAPIPELHWFPARGKVS